MTSHHYLSLALLLAIAYVVGARMPSLAQKIGLA